MVDPTGGVGGGGLGKAVSYGDRAPTRKVPKLGSWMVWWSHSSVNVSNAQNYTLKMVKMANSLLYIIYHSKERNGKMLSIISSIWHCLQERSHSEILKWPVHEGRAHKDALMDRHPFRNIFLNLSPPNWSFIVIYPCFLNSSYTFIHIMNKIQVQNKIIHNTCSSALCSSPSP